MGATDEGSGLAQRLVTAAAKAITQVPSATWSTDAQAATVAVLRELAVAAKSRFEDAHEEWQATNMLLSKDIRREIRQYCHAEWERLVGLADSLEGKPQ